MLPNLSRKSLADVDEIHRFTRHVSLPRSMSTLSRRKCNYETDLSKDIESYWNARKEAQEFNKPSIPKLFIHRGSARKSSKIHELFRKVSEVKISKSHISEVEKSQNLSNIKDSLIRLMPKKYKRQIVKNFDPLPTSSEVKSMATKIKFDARRVKNSLQFFGI
ncbi:unnamed protein product [Blepharisma stoltei]|uniref:Uncharacterized protein n=1 Tax=Blepharisma stoltei TaxID=1481888 RepID=A0AAU9JWZ6_9CILI|nr:unnamed protein product [Blepharisma stoltei]